MLEVKGKGPMPTYWVGAWRRPRMQRDLTSNPVPLLAIDYCGVQRPGFLIAIGLVYAQKPYYRLESLPLGQTLALQYAQLKLMRREHPEDAYVLLASSGGYDLYRHQSNLKPFGYAAALASICGQMRNQIDCSDHFWRLRVFQRCFEGTVAVDWLCDYLDCDRDEAVRVGQDCLEAKLNHHVLAKQPFADAGYFYRFWQDDKPEKCLLSRLNTPL